MMRLVARSHIALYRITAGFIGGRMVGAQVLLLTTTGRKSGSKRTQPLLCLATDTGWIVVASYGGADRHPAWYLNLQADPNVEIQVGAKRMRATARTLDAERRAAMWPRMVELYQGYDTYQARTEREIPLVEVTPS